MYSHAEYECVINVQCIHDMDMLGWIYYIDSPSSVLQPDVLPYFKTDDNLILQGRFADVNVNIELQCTFQQFGNVTFYAPCMTMPPVLQNMACVCAVPENVSDVFGEANYPVQVGLQVYFDDYKTSYNLEYFWNSALGGTGNLYLATPPPSPSDDHNPIIIGVCVGIGILVIGGIGGIYYWKRQREIHDSRHSPLLG